MLRLPARELLSADDPRHVYCLEEITEQNFAMMLVPQPIVREAPPRVREGGTGVFGVNFYRSTPKDTRITVSHREDPREYERQKSYIRRHPNCGSVPPKRAKTLHT